MKVMILLSFVHSTPECHPGAVRDAEMGQMESLPPRSLLCGRHIKNCHTAWGVTSALAEQRKSSGNQGRLLGGSGI